MKTAEVRTLFDYLKEHQAPLVKEVAGARRARARRRARRSRSSCRRQFELEVVRRFGFDDDALAARPDRPPVRERRGQRTTSASRRATSTTTSTGSSRRCTSSATASTSTRSTRRSSARRSARGVSLGMHESQSRMWENLVGRSLPFWRYFFPRLAGALPRARSPATTSSAGTARSTPSQPSLIRVEADEATYNLHIILRFELEQELLADVVPARAAARGVEPPHVGATSAIEVPDDTRGVLQDTHWAIGAIGYFPTYALGNLISAQLWERIVADLPELERRASSGASSARCATGCASTCTATAASSRRPRRSSARSGRSTIDPEPYVRYLRASSAAIYGISGSAA